MTTHLSARLVWHDRAWDGHICDCPSKNSYCVIQPHVRDSRNDDLEDKASGKPLAAVQEEGWQPPCSRDPIAFAGVGYTITHHDPLEFRDLPPIEEDIPPFSVCPSPYRWMREESFRQICEDESLDIPGPDDPKKVRGWVFEPDRQIRLLANFWGKLEQNQSLIFFYCNHGNPLNESLARILVGVGRISEIGPQLCFGSKPPKYPHRYPIWSRRITHDFENQGIRLPYHEYLKAGLDPTHIICQVPEGTMLDFSYVGEHVSDGVAVRALERLVQSVQAVKNEGKVPGEWDRHLNWLSNVLAECWRNRGAFPGAGSVLQYLGVESGTAFHKQALVPRLARGEDAWAYVLAILEGRRKCEERHYAGALKQAAERWAAYRLPRRNLLSLLARVELSFKQVQRIANEDERRTAGIQASDEQLLVNPYRIAEMDQGGRDADPVVVDVIDQGMRPEGDAARFLPADGRCAQDDPRRVRAVAVAVLHNASDQGDTLLPLAETLTRINQRFSEQRACRPDRELVVGQADFYREMIDFRTDAESPTMALKWLSGLEQEVSSRLKSRIQRKNDPSPAGWDWEELLKKEFGEGKGTLLPPEVEERARKEKAQALRVMYEARFCVLTGRAGTGKTSVLRVFLKGLEDIQGRKPILLLAPTGKARVRLMERTKRDDGSVRDAYTIHQFLMRNDWLNPDNFALRLEGGRQQGSPTVIIDEASMIPMDLFGVLLRALDLNKITRLILVGDPNQLPPIGPGRPFVDIIAWLESDGARRHLLAKLVERARHEDHNSQALLLADGYLREEPTPGDDALLSQVARQDVGGDLEVHFWRDESQLETILTARMRYLLHLTDGENAYRPFNASLGFTKGSDPDPRQAEHWQILSPVRNHQFGTTEINRRVQLKYKAGLIRRRKPRPFGDQELVWTDKVIQVFNRSMRSWPRDSGLDYVANGEIGLVTSTSDDPDSLDVMYATQPEASYRYFRNQVDDNLELAYALTVHKAQGSDFELVFLVLPRNASTLSRELLYTGLTRFRKKMVLLIERDTTILENLRNPKCSDTLLRNTHLFVPAARPETGERFYATHLIHRTATGVLVRSKSEVIVADTLTRLGISYEYEQKLPSRTNPADFRLPDFTVSYQGDTFYWEHLGMLSVPSYREQWERKQAWYEANRYSKRLVTSDDGPDGSIDASAIERTARHTILGQH